MASARIGSLTIATRENVFDSKFGIDITQQRLRFPLGLAPTVTRQILADNFIAFDSFDGANFDVSGNEIFQNRLKQNRGGCWGIPTISAKRRSGAVKNI